MYAVWTRTEGWKYTYGERTVELDRQMYRRYCRAVRTGVRVGKQIENAGGCTLAPLLCIHNHWETVVLCILHILMAVGKYLSVWIRRCSHLLKPAPRTRLATLLCDAKIGVLLAGKGAPDWEESWNLLAHWEEIAKLLRLGANTKRLLPTCTCCCKTSIAQGTMRKHSSANGLPKNSARPFCPRCAPTTSCGWRSMHAVLNAVLKEVAPLGLAMVELMNAILKDICLTTTARGGARFTSAQRDARLLMQAMRRGFLLKELPQWVGGADKAPMQMEALAHMLREIEAMGTE